MEYKLIKTDSGTDWTAFKVVKSDTARWVQEDIDNYNEYAEGFNEGYEQKCKEIVELKKLKEKK